MCASDFPRFVKSAEKFNDGRFARICPSTHVNGASLTVVHGERFEPLLDFFFGDTVVFEDSSVVFVVELGEIVVEVVRFFPVFDSFNVRDIRYKLSGLLNGKGQLFGPVGAGFGGQFPP